MPRHATKTSFIKGDPRITQYVSARREYTGSSNPNFKGGPIIGFCVICKKEFMIPRNQIENRIVCSRKCQGIWFSKTLIKERSTNWKGGITPINQLLKNSKQYKEWRELVFKRDNFTCQKCGTNNVYINAHHIKSFSNFPNLRFEISNGITLCESCHSLTGNFKGKVRNEEKVQCQNQI